MQDHVPEVKSLSALQFTVCLLAALARRDYTAFWAPRSDPAHTVDIAAVAASQYLQQYNDEVFDYRFRLYLHPNYNYSEVWQDELDTCERTGLITLLKPQVTLTSHYWYRLECGWLELLSAEFPGNEELWDDVANVFIEAIQCRQQPSALAGASLLW